jgi:PIN domain nuclease of toxin-antitoxin system
LPTIVLDASALLALLLDELGSTVVRPLLADAAMSTVNLAEVAGHYARHGATAEQTEQILAPLPIEYFTLASGLALDIGQMLPATRSAGLSLGDRACLALARRLGLPAVTADRRWAEVADAAGVKITLIR